MLPPALRPWASWLPRLPLKSLRESLLRPQSPARALPRVLLPARLLPPLMPPWAVWTPRPPDPALPPGVLLQSRLVERRLQSAVSPQPGPPEAAMQSRASAMAVPQPRRFASNSPLADPPQWAAPGAVPEQSFSGQVLLPPLQAGPRELRSSQPPQERSQQVVSGLQGSAQRVQPLPAALPRALRSSPPVPSAAASTRELPAAFSPESASRCRLACAPATSRSSASLRLRAASPPGSFPDPCGYAHAHARPRPPLSSSSASSFLRRPLPREHPESLCSLLPALALIH